MKQKYTDLQIVQWQRVSSECLFLKPRVIEMLSKKGKFIYENIFLKNIPSLLCLLTDFDAFDDFGKWETELNPVK